MKIWLCEDLENPEQSGFGKSKREAQQFVSGNRGYDNYTGEKISQCVADGWCKPAVRIEVPKVVALVLLKTCQI